MLLNNCLMPLPTKSHHPIWAMVEVGLGIELCGHCFQWTWYHGLNAYFYYQHYVERPESRSRWSKRKKKLDFLKFIRGDRKVKRQQYLLLHCEEPMELLDFPPLEDQVGYFFFHIQLEALCLQHVPNYNQCKIICLLALRRWSLATCWHELKSILA